MRAERQRRQPEADLVAGQEQRRRAMLIDVLYVLAPLVLLASVWLAVTWYSGTPSPTTQTPRSDDRGVPAAAP